MKNYFNKQRDGTLKQIAKLYEEKDVILEVLRHNGGGGKNDNASIYLKQKKRSKYYPRK